MLNRLTRYGPANSYDLLKAIAIITMIIDHFGFFFFPEYTFLRAIGRIAFACFAFAVGFNQKYQFSYNLLVMALIMLGANLIWQNQQIAWYNYLQSSIFFSFLIIRFTLEKLTKIINQQNIWYIISWLIFFDLPARLIFSYGCSGIAIALSGYCLSKFNGNLLSQKILLVVLLEYFIVEVIFFKFEFAEISILSLLMILVYLSLKHFTINAISVKPQFQKFIMFLSRYSMEIYFIHFELFIAISYFL